MRVFIALMLCLIMFLVAGCGGRCRAVEAAACSTELSTCQNGCGGDVQCLDSCTVKYCDCLDDKGCDRTGSCN